jgi:membrane fusion protein, multidrug efflux system
MKPFIGLAGILLAAMVSVFNDQVTSLSLVHVDAYNVDLNGYVEGIAAASGASFAPIEPNNATGNFTKIVQRLPVKIDVDPNQPLANLLRVGLSVETTIHTALEDVVTEQRRSSEGITGN